MTKLLLISVIAISLGACATGTELLTDQAYPAIEDPTAVSILTEMPEGAEQIAVLKASSGLGKAVEVLKRRAAKVGANAVVLTGQDTTPLYEYIGYGASGYIEDTHKERLEGIAIFVR